MNDARMPIGRWERAKQDKRDRSMAAARELFAEHGVGEVTTQQVADRADTCARSRPTGPRGSRRAGSARSRATCVG